MKPGPGFLDQLAQAHGPGTKGQCAIVYRAGTHVLPMALLRLSRRWMVYLGHWTGSRGYLAQSKKMKHARLTPDPLS